VFAVFVSEGLSGRLEVVLFIFDRYSFILFFVFGVSGHTGKISSFFFR